VAAYAPTSELSSTPVEEVEVVAVRLRSTRLEVVRVVVVEELLDCEVLENWVELVRVVVEELLDCETPWKPNVPMASLSPDSTRAPIVRGGSGCTVFTSVSTTNFRENHAA